MKFTKKLVLFSAVLACVLSLFSCKTTDSAAKADQSSQSVSKDNESKAARYQAMADAFTKQCPIELNDSIVLASLTYQEKENALVYTFILTDPMYETMDNDTLASTQTVIKDTLIKSVQENEDVALYREDSVTIIHIYKANNDTELFTVVLHKL